MTRKTIVITGASDGIGAAAARRIRRSGENVVVVGRSESKAAAMAAELDADLFRGRFLRPVSGASLGGQDSFRVSAHRRLGQQRRRHVHQGLQTADGHENTFQVNYLAPFLLTTQLMDVLVDSRATVVNTTSSSQKLLPRATIDDLETTDRRRPSTAYALTKLAIVLFTKELHRRYHASGLSDCDVSPGLCRLQFRRGVGIADPRLHEVPRPIRPGSRPPRPGSRPAGLAGVEHARCRLDARRVLLEAQNRQSQSGGLQPALARELWDRTIQDHG